MEGRTGVEYIVQFNARDGEGQPVTGEAANMAPRVRALDTATDDGSVAAVVEIGNGRYSMAIRAAFTTAQGAGNYGWQVEWDDGAGLADIAGGVVRFLAADEDTLAATQATLATAAAVASVQADTDDIQTRLPAALVGGRMDSDVGNMQTDVVDAAALATDAVNEIRDSILADSTPFNGADVAAILLDTGTTLPGLIAALNDISVADILTALLTSGDTVDVALSRLDNIDADVATNIPALIAALNDLSIADVQSAMTAQGYTAARAPNLDNLDAAVSTRSSHSASDVDTTLSASHGAGNWEGAAAAPDQLEVRQGWTRRTSPSSRFRAIIHLEQNGDRVALPATAEVAILATDRTGATIAAFTTSGVTAGAKGYFGIETTDYTPVSGEVITAEATITLSGIGGGTHVGRTQIAFPEF